MTITQRDLLFLLANAVIGALVGLAVRAGHLSETGAVPPLMLIFVGMAAIELIAFYVARIPLGQLVGMPSRIMALIASFAASMLARAV